MLKLGGVAFVVLVLNLPFGYWRAGERRFTLPWFLAVHAPVPLVVGVRLLTGLGWHLATVPVVALAFLAGQVLGGRVRSWGRGRSGTAS
jgi:hypothetical protein